MRKFWILLKMSNINYLLLSLLLLRCLISDALLSVSSFETFNITYFLYFKKINLCGFTFWHTHIIFWCQNFLILAYFLLFWKLRLEQRQRIMSCYKLLSVNHALQCGYNETHRSIFYFEYQIWKIEFTVIISILDDNFGVRYEIALRTKALHYQLILVFVSELWSSMRL